MTSPGTAHASLKVDFPSVSGRPLPKPCPRLLAEHPEMFEHIDTKCLGREKEVTVDFRTATFRNIPAASAQVFEELVIFTGKTGLVIGSTTDGTHQFLTGIKGRENDCLILFRHAYGKVSVRLGVGSLGAEAHVGFLTHGTFKEAWHATYGRQTEMRQPDDKGFWTELPYEARHLNELQGIVWRGGTLCIERITLEP